MAAKNYLTKTITIKQIINKQGKGKACLVSTIKKKQNEKNNFIINGNYYDCRLHTNGTGGH